MPYKANEARAASGNAAFGSMPFATTRTSPRTWITSTSIVARGLYPSDWIGDAAKDVQAGEPGG